jgi:uncharacterized protein (DUF697 family)
MFQDRAIMPQKINPAEWHVVPSTTPELEAVSKKCRSLVIKRAALSAGVSAVPIPGLDIVTDLGMLSKLIDDINQEFGLTPAQIERLQPHVRVATYQAIVGTGSLMVGKLITSGLIVRLVQRLGVKMVVKRTAKFVPIAGQLVSAALGFAVFRAIGNQHIEACAVVAAELVSLRLASR